MKKFLMLLTAVLLCLLSVGCSTDSQAIQIAATTLPVYDFASQLCAGTDISVTRLVTEEVSCLHDYSLQVRQMQAIEEAELVIISGAGLEDFLDDVLPSAPKIIDASVGIELHCTEQEHDHDHTNDEHFHEQDPHIWLSPANAKLMASNICKELSNAYPQYRDAFSKNLSTLNNEFDTLAAYAQAQLAELSTREIITFHDGFSYMAEAFDLTILHAIEEESGSEASAAELIKLIQLVNSHSIQVIFTEKNSGGSAASVIAAETNTSVFALDMAMSGDSYFTAMYYNIDTLKEALK